MAGLAAALVVQALILRARTVRRARGRRAVRRPRRRHPIAGGLAHRAAAAAGVRRGCARRRSRRRCRSPGAYAAGVAVWVVPLVVRLGRAARLLARVASQGAEDLTGVTMLWTKPTPRQLLARVRVRASSRPWGCWPLAAAVLVLRRRRRGLAARGRAARALVDARRGVRSVPGLRSAVSGDDHDPLRAAAGGAGRATSPCAALLAAISRWRCWAAARPRWRRAGGRTIRRSTAYAQRRRAGVPDAGRHARPQPSTAPVRPPVLAMHRRQDFDMRRPLQWVGARCRRRSPSASPRRRKHEWLELVKYWNGGGRAPVWFVADPLRSDLALVHHDGPPRGLPLAASSRRADRRRPARTRWTGT